MKLSIYVSGSLEKLQLISYPQLIKASYLPLKSVPFLNELFVAFFLLGMTLFSASCFNVWIVEFFIAAPLGTMKHWTRFVDVPGQILVNPVRG